MHPVYQVVLTIWILASLGDSIPEPVLDYRHHVSIRAKHNNLEANGSSNRTTTILRDEGGNKSKNTNNSANFLENPPGQIQNTVTGNRQGIALVCEDLLNNITYNTQDRILLTRLKRAAISNSGKNISPKRHEKQKKSNYITPRKIKLDTVSKESKKLKRIKSPRKQKQFDIQLPFLNLESEKEKLEEDNNTGNETNTLLRGHSSIGVSGNGGAGQFVINADEVYMKNGKDSRMRRVKKHKQAKRVRVPLPFNLTPSEMSEQRKKDLLKREKNDMQPVISYKRRRKQKKRLPPLH